MGRYVVRRLGQLIVVVLGATMILFACLFVLPAIPSGRSRAVTRRVTPP